MNDTTPEIGGIYFLLGEIKGQLTALQAAITQRNAEDDKKHDSHNRRLTTLERMVWIASGVALAGGGALGAVAGAFVK